MSESEARKTATRYINEQAEIMRKYGESPKMDGKRFETTLKETTRTFKVLRGGKAR
jgi:hypothetical protein